eukprot:1468041-Amphidinium_carterae.1
MFKSAKVKRCNRTGTAITAINMSMTYCRQAVVPSFVLFRALIDKDKDDEVLPWLSNYPSVSQAHNHKFQPTSNDVSGFLSPVEVWRLPIGELNKAGSYTPSHPSEGCQG